MEDPRQAIFETKLYHSLIDYRDLLFIKYHSLFSSKTDNFAGYIFYYLICIEVTIVANLESPI